jgi:spermidine synthase
MGTTFPWMMAFVREHEPEEAKSFSFLYAANVLGALSGTLLSAFVLIEVFGFHRTLAIAAGGNFLIAGIALWLGSTTRRDQRPHATPTRGQAPSGEGGWLMTWLLFSTGFASMGMEVVWARAFTPVIKTQVYSFAAILAAYLLATFVGSAWYRADLRRGRHPAIAHLLGLLCVSGLLPAIANDVRLMQAGFSYSIHWPSALLLLGSLCPFCGLLGYLTPRLVDQYALGSPLSAGRAYAVNITGCILGPLFACYALLPWFSERHALILLCVPFLASYLVASRSSTAGRRIKFALAIAVPLAVVLFISCPYEDHILKTEKPAEVRRDYAASVVSFGQGADEILVVNGVGMTRPGPITQFMAHLPLAFHEPRAKRVLVICFGIGTTYCSSLSWDVETTAVELVPSVKDAFGFFRPDAARFVSHPKGRIVIDDGRRFLKRTDQKYDVIIVDPPPPPEAAGSSLLYSKEFYALARQHLGRGGIIQAWLLGDERTLAAELRSLCDSFPYVRCFVGLGGFGVHTLASMEPIARRSASELVARMPGAARTDLLQWAPGSNLVAYVFGVVSREVPPQGILDLAPTVSITDDRPYNEYFLLRQLSLY